MPKDTVISTIQQRDTHSLSNLYYCTISKVPNIQTNFQHRNNSIFSLLALKFLCKECRQSVLNYNSPYQKKFRSPASTTNRIRSPHNTVELVEGIKIQIKFKKKKAQESVVGRTSLVQKKLLRTPYFTYFAGI